MSIVIIRWCTRSPWETQASQGNQSKGRSLSFLMLYVSKSVEVLCRRLFFLGEKRNSTNWRDAHAMNIFFKLSNIFSQIFSWHLLTKSLRNQTLLSFLNHVCKHCDFQESRRLYTLQKYHQKPRETCEKPETAKSLAVECSLLKFTSMFFWRFGPYPQ